MKRSLYIRFWILLVITMAWPFNLLAISSPESFVKSFYADYNKDTKTYFGERSNLPKFVTPELYKLLLKDDLNRKTVKGEICGFVDFDPFLNSQEDLGEITSVNVIKTSPQLLVAIYYSTKKQPNMVVHLVEMNKDWRIANILYPNAMSPDGKDLVTLLQYLQKQKCN